jgi:hypothetical protein
MCRANNGPDLLIRHDRLSGALDGLCDGLCKPDMEKHRKWMVYGSDGLGGKGCTHSARSCTCPFSGSSPSHWFHGIVHHLEGCAASHRSICSRVATLKPVDTRNGASESEVDQAAL